MAILEDFRICGQCLQIYGYWARPRYGLSSDNNLDPDTDTGLAYFRQSCKCEPKSGFPDKPYEGGKWPDRDIHDFVTLCYCCAQVKLESGYKFSCWFCDACKQAVISLNDEYGQAVIPMGRHSFMAGISLKGTEARDSEKVEGFVGALKGLFSRIDRLEEWSAEIRRRVLRSLQIEGEDPPLEWYLLQIAEPSSPFWAEPLPSKPRAFLDMKHFLLNDHSNGKGGQL